MKQHAPGRAAGGTKTNRHSVEGVARPPFYFTLLIQRNHSAWPEIENHVRRPVRHVMPLDPGVRFVDQQILLFSSPFRHDAPGFRIPRPIEIRRNRRLPNVFPVNPYFCPLWVGVNRRRSVEATAAYANKGENYA
jgi:hypothetical protein